MESATKRRRFALASWANVLGNVAKIVAEGIAGFLFGSVALLADAAHSLGDLVASVVVLIWGDSRFEGADADHPHGHARIEPLTALFVGAVIVILGANLLYESGQSLLVGGHVEFSYLLVVALGFSMADMYLVYWYTMRMNATLGSTALKALAVDCLNDMYTTVAALVGVIGIGLGFPVLDALAGLFVSLLVIYQGVEIGRENLSYLAGKAASDARRAEIRETILAHPQTHGVHDLAVFYDGPTLEVEAHVEVDGSLTLAQAHDIESDLVRSVLEYDDVGDAHLHLDPAGMGEWKDADEQVTGTH
ncbi:cation diffusion facilitator family transporter [Halovenus aranensis]|uniref:Cation diffusion facilitator family transporter n=1 Tax=Halovenus aranensis TaxID=890420 RepID=A0A1G8W8R2_9EURY|nr:cation diffusion facilitator family transporter [Halovenus aranensis]SDJ74497.1 cation diffusion facilitator family transporter [Halovenus aranensis]